VGGTEKQLVELAMRLDRERYNVVMACKFREGQLIEELERVAIPIYQIPLQSFTHLNTFLQFKRLVSYLKENKIQIVHTTGDMGNIFVALAGMLAHVPVIITSRRDLGDLTPIKLRYIKRLVAQYCNGIIVNAEEIRTRLIDEEQLGASKIFKISNGIDLSRF